MTKRRKKKQQRLANRKFYIRRKSLTDDTLFFCTRDNQRIYFEKASWAAFILSSFLPEQGARVVCLPMDEGDVDYRDWLPTVLPDNVTVEEYLQAVEQVVSDRRKGREPSRRAVRSFERQVGWR